MIKPCELCELRPTTTWYAEHDEPYTVQAWLAIYAEHPYEHAAQITAARASAGERAVTS